MLKIGITGGIGSGKSTVAKVFEVLGIPVYYADEAAKRLMNGHEELKKRIIELFGEASYIDGKLNRPYLASVVFNNKEQLELLNSVVHPATIADAEEWFRKQHAPYVLKEAALLFESGAAEGLDLVIGVSAPEALRLRRVMQREGVTAAEVKQRMRNQVEESVKMRLCDFIIINDEQSAVLPQVLQLHQQLLRQISGNKSE